MENLTNAEDLNKRTLITQEKIKAGGKDALEARFELNKLAEEAENVKDEAEKENVEYNENNKLKIEESNEVHGILSESEKSLLDNKEKLFTENRKSIVEKYLVKITNNEKEDHFVASDMKINNEKVRLFIEEKITEKFIEQIPGYKYVRVGGLELKKEFGEKVFVEEISPLKRSAEKEIENKLYYNEMIASESITSTLDAVADKNPNNQPLGVDVIELAKKHNLPAVLITAEGHVKGEEAVRIVDTFLKQKNLIDISNNRFDPQSPDIFFANKYDNSVFYNVVARDGGSYDDFLEKEDNRVKNGEQFKNDKNWPENWQMTFDRIKEKVGNKEKYKILIVEDSPINFDIAKIALLKDIESGQIELVHAPDYESAQLLIEGNKANVDGVVTDLYFPDKLDSNDKTHGDQVFIKLAGQYIGKETAEMLLKKAKEIYGRE